jgi:hypothetical protein
MAMRHAGQPARRAIITHGIFRASDLTTTLAVTGGTGAYDGVTGTMVSRRADGGDVDVIRLR